MNGPRPVRQLLSSSDVTARSSFSAGPPPPIPARNYRRASARSDDGTAADSPVAEPLFVIPEKPAHLKRAAQVTVTEEKEATPVLDMVCVECGYDNACSASSLSSASSGSCYSCSSPLQALLPGFEVVVPATLRCAAKACGHLNYLDARCCSRCARSFADTDSFIQEDLFNGLKEALGGMSEDEEDREIAAVLGAAVVEGYDDDMNDEMMMSILAPELAAPPAPHTRKQTVMVQYAEQLRRDQSVNEEGSESEIAEALLISEEDVKSFVLEAIGSQGWEPALTLKAADGVERFQMGSFKMKSQTVLSRLSVEETEDLLWPLASLPRYDAQFYECKQLKEMSPRAVVGLATMEVENKWIFLRKKL
jgi:hypothetical protein